MKDIDPNSPPLVIDKSFAHAIKPMRLSQLSRERTFLVPLAFIYEVFTTITEKIFPTLDGFEEFRIVDISTLLRSEIDTGKPCRSAELPPLITDMNVLSRTWKPGSFENEMADQHKKESVDPLMDLWNELVGLNPPGFAPEELVATAGTEANFTRLCEMLRDRERIEIIAKEMKFCHAEKLDESWFTFRFIQTFTLQSLVLRRLYPNTQSDRSQRRIEHDLQDMEYLALGLHVGSLATFEASKKIRNASMGWRFKLLEPDFQLVVS